MTLVAETPRPAIRGTDTMRATVFHGPNDIRVEAVPRAPRRRRRGRDPRHHDDDLRHRHPHPQGRVPGPARAWSSATSRSASSTSSAPASPATRSASASSSARSRRAASVAPACPGNLSQCGHGDGFEALGGWRFGNTIDGAQAEYLLVPSAQANLTPIPDGVTDEQVVLLADIASTGFSGAESGGVKIGDAVVVFAQGPIGLCATAGAKLMGASLVIGVDSDPVRLEMARRMGADVVARLHPGRCRRRGQAADRRRRRRDRSRRSARRRRSRTRCAACGPAARCRASASTRASSRCRTTRSRRASAITASSRRSARAARSGCGGSSPRSQSGRFDPLPLITHRFALDDIVEAYDLFSNRRDGVLKVAIRP